MLRPEPFTESTSLGWAQTYLGGSPIKLLVAALALLTVIPSNAKAADVLVGEKGIIVIVGRIEPGDDKNFRHTVVAEIKRRGKTDPVGILHIYSPGGDSRNCTQDWRASSTPSTHYMESIQASEPK